MLIEKYKAKDGFRWRIRQGRAKKIVADSGEAYASMSNLTRALKRFLKSIRGTVFIRDLTERHDDSS